MYYRVSGFCMRFCEHGLRLWPGFAGSGRFVTPPGLPHNTFCLTKNSHYKDQTRLDFNCDCGLEAVMEKSRTAIVC
jgi:hypothetical protein